MKRKSIIISISGYSLKKKEKELIKKEKPWGLILFRRNIKSIKQTKKLITNIRKSINDKKFPILIDEEGGRVCRLSNFLDNRPYSQRFFGKLYQKDKKFGVETYENYLFSICQVFKKLGININTVPVMDIIKKNTHKIIGDRAYSNDIKTIKSLATICSKVYQKNKIATVIKHIPGHGSSSSDSHIKMPIVNHSYQILSKNDFKCFKNINSHFAMTAHILFKKIDPNNVVTHSKKIIEKIIRKKIGFKGIIISDDISMKALRFDILKNASKSLAAGCNLVLYCGGIYSESAKLLRATPFIDKFTAKKTSEFYKFLS
tara:strand:+ start:1000 stop:1947 length:948 start_codon:yes stop_codon:yes gene_type:complete